jgi:hypothetical protein
MIAVESIVLTPGKEFTKRVAGEEMGLLALANDRQLPLDLVIRAFEQKQTYQRFAQCMVGKHPISFVGEVELAINREGRIFVAVVGLYKVLFLNFAALTIRELLTLYREEMDDRGFYRMQLHPLPDAFLVNYESGMARVSSAGEVVWHRKMVWNDVFVREEDGALLFKNELNPKGFHISVADGSKFPV